MYYNLDNNNNKDSVKGDDEIKVIAGTEDTVYTEVKKLADVKKGNYEVKIKRVNSEDYTYAKGDIIEFYKNNNKVKEVSLEDCNNNGDECTGSQIYYNKGDNYLVLISSVGVYGGIQGTVYIYDLEGNVVKEYDDVYYLKGVNDGYLLSGSDISITTKYEEFRYNQGVTYYIDSNLNEKTIYASVELSCYEGCFVQDTYLYNGKIVTIDLDNMKYKETKKDDYLLYDLVKEYKHDKETDTYEDIIEYSIRWNDDSSFDIVDKENNVIVKNFFTANYLVRSYPKIIYGMYASLEENGVYEFGLYTCNDNKKGNGVSKYIDWCDNQVINTFKFDTKTKTVSKN